MEHRENKLYTAVVISPTSYNGKAPVKRSGDVSKGQNKSFVRNFYSCELFKNANLKFHPEKTRTYVIKVMAYIERRKKTTKARLDKGALRALDIGSENQRTA